MSGKQTVFGIIKGLKRFYVIALIATALTAFCVSINPMIIKSTVDSVIDNKPLEAAFYISWLIEKAGGISVLERNIWICGAAIVVVTLMNGLFSFLRGRMTALASEKMANRLKDNLYDHLQRLPYNYHVKAQTGDLIQRCTSDVDTIRRFFSAQLVEIGRTVFMVFIIVPTMFMTNVKLAAVSMIIFPVIFTFSYLFFKNIKKSFKQYDEKEGELSTVLQENLSGVRVVRAFGRGEYEAGKFTEKNTDLKKFGLKLTSHMANFWTTSDLISISQITAIIIFGLYLVNAGELTVGELIMFNSYEGMLIWPVRQLGRILSDFGKMQVSVTRVCEILNTEQEKDTENAVEANLRQDIEFKNLSFGYEKNTPILKDVSFKVKAGQTAAFLGSTGSGKSTIMHILLRLYDYDGGSVKIGRTELKDIKKSHLREKVGIVLQEPFLFSKTILENIKMARDGAENPDVYSAAKIAAVHDVINSFEKGYDTVIGEKGVTLSGGQKQRVAIARTVIKNSDILVFDDSLSAVDTETDAQIRSALREKQKDVTTFIISQRITTLMNADIIFVVEDGKITASGTHSELISKDGLYRRIWDIQTMLEDDFDEAVK